MGWSVEQIRIRAELGRTTVSQALNDENPAPSGRTVTALARALRMDADPLLDLLDVATSCGDGASGIGDSDRRTPAVWNLPRRNPFFTGRAEILDQMHRLLCGTGTDVPSGGRTLSLQGVGGIGKTQLATEYAYRHATGYGLVWWVHAESSTLAESCLAELAEILGLPVGGTQSVLIRRLWSVLSQRDDWLLVYDNLDNPTGADQVPPLDCGRVLITSRSPAVGRLTPDMIQVSPFDRGESLALLRRRCPDLAHDEAGQVCEAIGDLPLAVEQAGCFLAESGLEVDAYVALLGARPEEAGLADPTLDLHPGLANVVSLGRERLRTACPEAGLLLDQMAFCAPLPLPVSPSETTASRSGYVHLGDVATTVRIMRALTGLGLVQRSGAYLQVHRLVQGLLRSLHSEEEQVVARNEAQKLLATARPGIPDDPSAWPAYAALTPHAQAVAEAVDGEEPSGSQTPEPEEFRSLLLNVCRYLHVTGQYINARTLSERAYARWTQSLGSLHQDTLRAAHNVGRALRALGAYEAARELNENTLEGFRRVLGEDHAYTLASATSLAYIVQHMGDYQAARELNETTLTRYRRVLGEDHVATLNSASNLAWVRHVLGDFETARALDEDILARRRRVLGEEHPQTLLSGSNLGRDLFALGHFEAARALDEDILARRRRILGEDHAHTLVSGSNLGRDLFALGHFEAARALDKDTLARRRRVLGEDHPQTLASAADLEASSAAVRRRE
ncbi:tetratricopeptide repeat protein [Streptomyces sp. ISL-100]|nr:tetratricopeptide repeat protein [Streptomyces sp. ISL-100]